MTTLAGSCSILACKWQTGQSAICRCTDSIVSAAEATPRGWLAYARYRATAYVVAGYCVNVGWRPAAPAMSGVLQGAVSIVAGMRGNILCRFQLMKLKASCQAK